MQVKDVMSDSCEFIEPDATLQDAARKMRDLGCGFLPIGSESRGRLEGVITDRDIVVRAIADGENPAEARVRDWQTRGPLYCFEKDDLDSAVNSMRQQQIFRLVVLDNPDSKKLSGVITLGDIARHDREKLAASALTGIAQKAA